MNIIENQLPEQLTKNDLVGVDLEIFQMGSRKLHRPTGTFASMQVAVNDNDVYLITDERKVAPTLKRIQKARWAFHNAHFDLFHLRRWADVPVRDDVLDTMIVERIAFANYYENFGLKDLARRWFDVRMEKDTRKEFETANYLTDDMKHYGCYDAHMTRKIAQKQMQELDTWVFSAWYNIELPALWALLDLRGFTLHVSKWRALAREQEIIVADLQDALGFNPGSPPQTKKALLDAGLQVNSTGEPVLKSALLKVGIDADNEWEEGEFDYILDDYPWAGIVLDVLKYREAAKRANAYGENFITNFVESDGKVHASFNVLAARTGRSSSADPNLQQVPRVKAYRQCFIASKGCRIIKADYSGQELRILAQISQDDAMLEAFRHNDDVHLNTARYIFNDNTIQKDDPRRQAAKSLGFGMVYGIGASALAAQLKISKEEAQQYINGYFNLYKGVRTWMQKQERLDTVSTLTGRKVYLNKYARGSRNQSFNFPIQSSASEMLKLALGNIYYKWPSEFESFGVIAPVHDELVIEAKTVQAKKVSRFVVSEMEAAMKSMLPDVPAVVDAVIGKTWGG